MNFNHMIDTLYKTYDIELTQLDLNDKIRNIKLISSDITEWKTDTLYIGHLSMLTVNDATPIQVVLCTTENIVRRNAPSNIAMIKEDNLNSVFNMISSMFYSSLHITGEFSKLVAMLMRGENASFIMNEAANGVQNPIIVVDTSYHVLCYSNNRDITDPFWTENIKRGYCTYEFILAVNDIVSKQITPNNSDSFTIVCPASPRSKLCSKIILNNHIIGYTIMLEEKTPLNDFQLEYLPKISYIVADMLIKNPEFDGVLGSNSEHILHNILADENELNIRARIEASKLTFPERMRCIVVGTIDYQNSERNLDKKQLLRNPKERLSQLFPNSYYTYYKDNLVFVVKVNETDEIHNEQEEKLEDLFLNDLLTVGISQGFTDIYQLKQYYIQCVKLQEVAAFMGIKKQILYHEKYIFENILNGYQDQYHLRDFIHPALLTLRAYDSKNDGSLYETLHVYLECKFNLKQTSCRLFIHRNSLTYRMEKILELTKIDLDDMNTLFWLGISYRIEYYLGVSNPE